MTNVKKIAYRLTGLICAAAALLFSACEKIPDHCGRMELYNPDYEFCFSGKAHKLCRDGKYNPLTEGCNPKDNTVGTRCVDSSFVPVGTPCGGYTLTTGSAPADGGTVQRFPNLSNYAAGEQVTLSAIADSGYIFAGWAGASTETSPAVTINMSSNQPLVAMFSPISASGANTHALMTTAFPDNGGRI